MRRALACLVSCCAIGASPADAQRIDLDGSVGYKDGAWRAAVASQWRLSVGSRLTLGTGARLTYYAGEPATYRNQGTSGGALADELQIDPSVWGLNLMVSAQARLVGSLSAGANIDLLGVAGGPSRDMGQVELEPARGSILLYGDNDRGSLNSEFFLAVPIGASIELRGGMSHYVVGYSAREGTLETRYLRFDTLPFFGVRWRP